MIHSVDSRTHLFRVHAIQSFDLLSSGGWLGFVVTIPLKMKKIKWELLKKAFYAQQGLIYFIKNRVNRSIVKFYYTFK